ncbi:hypothetical protein EG68_05063 [Paragonimus skrjabini miyazakii]|uniref:Origin recognition complex subunit 1 n=1 Tax=Paragonimus skrjabini miyazakii TaxID=59628 RepID=A0A8S9YWS4_9TREM|nr:hypothetical protein EG68_05063 [Paragonimus skrjabini miyazakii]
MSASRSSSRAWPGYRKGKENNPVKCLDHTRQTWTAPVISNKISPRTPRRACKDLALARLLAPIDLDLSDECHIKSPVLHKRSNNLPTAKRNTCRSVLTPSKLDSPVRRLRSLSISMKTKLDVRSSAHKKTMSACRSKATNASSPEDQQNDDHMESSTSSSLSVTTSDPDDSSCSESSDCDSPASCIRKRRPRGRSVKWTPRSPKTPAVRPKSSLASRTSSKPHCVLPKRTFSARPSNRTTTVFTGSASGEGLPGREHEFDSIYTFISGKLLQNTGGCMYISGLPGTGKTASVNAVLSAMTNAQATFQKIVINGMQVNDPKQVYVHILKQLTGTLATARQAAQVLECEFCAPRLSKSRRVAEDQLTPVVLVIDELDLLCTRRQDVLYNLFDWPTRPSGRRSLIVLAIANTMDLPERLLHPRVASRLGLTRLTFAPYSHEQLVSIVHSQLACSLANSFQEKALELAARKVAAVSGDVRRALDICRRAAEIVTQSKSSKEIGITHINAALKEMFTTPKLTAIRTCSVYEKLFLRALIAECQARSSEEARLNRCIQQMCALCRLEGFACPTTSEVFDICASLGAHKLLLTEASKRDTSMFVRLNCSKADVLFALKPRAGTV